MFKILKRFKIFFIILIVFLFFCFLLSRGHIYNKSELSYGVTFSKKKAQDLGLDWQKLFLEIFSDLGVKKIRLSAYWDEIEAKNNKFDWTDLDWQVKKASYSGAEVILAVGYRLPRWPECHYPEWVEGLDKNTKDEELLSYITAVISRYKDNTSISAWQVENEPFLPHFGQCPPPDKELLDKEIRLVKMLDTRPIIMTDSGELSVWVPAAKRADIFGTTMYRDTYSKQLKRYIHYPIEPGFFRFKKNITRFFTRPEKWIVIELQAEPWGPEPFQNINKEERDLTMNLEKFREIIEFSSKTGFSEFYLWGVEWWYWEREANNDNSLWNEARLLF